MKANSKISMNEAELIGVFSKTLLARADDVREALRAGTLTVEGLLETISILAPKASTVRESSPSAILRAAKPRRRLDDKLEELSAAVKSFLNVGPEHRPPQQRRHEISFARCPPEGDGLTERVAAGLSLEVRGELLYVGIGGCDAGGSWILRCEEGAQVLSTIRSVWNDGHAIGLIREFLASEGATT